MQKNHPTVTLLFFFISILGPTALPGQSENLARKGALGVRLEPITDAHRQAAGLAELKGVYISEVLPGGTGDALDLEPGDILLRIDGKPTDSVQEIVRITQSWRGLGLRESFFKSLQIMI